MPLRLRLQRWGKKKKPFYRIVVADSRAPRDGKFIEIVGYYHPQAKEPQEKLYHFKEDRVLYWLSQGVKPTDTVYSLLKKSGILDRRKNGNARKEEDRSEGTS